MLKQGLMKSNPDKNAHKTNGGMTMKRFMVLLLVAAFTVGMLAVPASATQYDPRYGPLVHVGNQGTPSGDDGGWNEGVSKLGWQGRSLLGCYDIRVTAPTLFLYFFDLMDVPDSPHQGNGNDRQSLDHDRRGL